MLVWWGAGVECVSALARLERDRVANAQSLLAGLGRLREYATRWHEVDPIDAVRDAAVRFLRVHPLRAADALQLAAAYVGAERRPTSLEFVTLDEALAVAAGKEGFALTSIGPVD
jgi:predicted nucleic acid-binding protein